VDDAWRASLRDAFRQAFDALDRAVRDCPEGLWERSLWPSTQPWPEGAALGAGRPHAERSQVFSAFWFVAWHALDCTHYDVEGRAFPEWAPPPPFSAAGEDCALDLAHYLPSRVFTRAEIGTYLADTRRKADHVVGGLTDEQADRLVPEGHRYAGMPYPSLLLLCLTHATEHAGQLSMFLGQHEIARET
jgi:hypothetical protein